jgi:putative transposase
VADITYIPTDEGWLYLAAVLDLYSRRIVGWAMRDSLHRQLALDALQMARQSRQPPPGLLHHSDRGSQYASDDYQALLTKYRMQASCFLGKKIHRKDAEVAEKNKKSQRTLRFCGKNQPV